MPPGRGREKGQSSPEGECAKGEDGCRGSWHQDLQDLITVHQEVRDPNLMLFPPTILLSTCLSEGIIVDNGQLVCLYLLSRLLQSELEKCLRLVNDLPMLKMENYFGNYIEPERSFLSSKWFLYQNQTI